MSRLYVLDQMSRAMHRIIRPSAAAPRFHEAPMQNSPKQAITTLPLPREEIDFSQAGPVLELVAAMHYRPAVQQIPVRQPVYIPRAPHAPTGNARADVPDQRLGIMAYHENWARDTYVFGPMSAPARLQSVPGYVAKSVQVTRSSPGYPKQALKAPRPNSGGGGCQDG
jgi:hypothetical protein